MVGKGKESGNVMRVGTDSQMKIKNAKKKMKPS